MHSLIRSALLSVIIGVSGNSLFGAAGNGPYIGKNPPPLDLAKILQAPADASANWEKLRGQVVIIDFWATWCGPCVESIPHFNELANALKDQPVQFLAVTDENEEVVTSFLKRTPIHAWIGLDGLGQPMRDRYGIDGIPTTVIVNQKGIVVAVTHPARLSVKDIEEVIQTGNSSLPTPKDQGAKDAHVERVPALPPVFEVSARRSGPLPAGHGTDCWEVSRTNADVSGQWATVRRAVLVFFDGREPLLDVETPLPDVAYDFVVRLAANATHADREQAVAPMFRSVFGLQIHRVQEDRDVYVLTAASTNAPGLTVPEPGTHGGGGEERGGLKLGKAQITWLPGYFEKWLHKPVFNETGLTNRYNVRLKWKMSKRELVLAAFDRRVESVVLEKDDAAAKGLSADQQRQIAAIRGELSDAELRKLPPWDRENIEILRAELAKPEDERFEPDPESIRSAVREQLGLELTLQRRSVEVLVVEKAGSAPIIPDF